MICYHHNDLDGKAAGFLVHKMKPEGLEDHPQNYYSVGYDDKLNKHTLKDDVVIVDISISEETYPMLMEICKTAKTVTWIDHHKTSLEVIDKHLDELQNTRNLTYFVSDCACGAVLTYVYFSLPKGDLQNIRSISDKEYYKIDAKFILNPYSEDNDINIILTRYQKNNESEASVYQYEYTIPTWLSYIDDYDCWKKNYTDTEAIFLGLESQNTDLVIGKEIPIFNDGFWEELYSDEEDVLEDAHESGSAIEQYLNARYARELADTFEWTFQGTKFLCKNGTGNSWNFCDKIRRYAAVILYNYAGSSGKWEYSVYSDESSKFDCSEFCKQFGGGGHFHASGFSTDHDIFTTHAKDIQPATICMNGLVSYRDAFEECIKNHSLTKNKGTKCFSVVNKASRKVFEDYELEVDYKNRKEIPKIDLIITSTASVKRPENLKNFYKIVTDLVENKHGLIFLAIIMDEMDSMGNPRPLEDNDDIGTINLVKIAQMILSAKGLVRSFDMDKDPIKSIANEVSYII